MSSQLYILTPFSDHSRVGDDSSHSAFRALSYMKEGNSHWLKVFAFDVCTVDKKRDRIFVTGPPSSMVQDRTPPKVPLEV